MTYLGREVKNGKLTVVSHFGFRHEYSDALCSCCQDVKPTDYPYVCNACVSDNFKALRDTNEVRELLHGKA